jgi:DNA-binding CsgD family transcriptional regulator/predicted negative regulator of RcsB-dependent stress response
LVNQELVGRKTELSQLEKSLETAAMGKAQLVLLAGEAGLGKTRLCQALVDSPTARPFLLLAGQALPQAQSWPFSLFLDPFRRYFSTLDSSISEVYEPALAHLLKLLPELQPLFPDVVPLPLPESNVPARQQYHLFQTVLKGLRALSASVGKPILLVLEDLHWADETSLELLAFLSQQIGVNAGGIAAPEGDCFFILGTYRKEAVSDNPALGRWLVQLNNQRQGRVFTLNPLSLEEHATLIAGILNRPVSAEFNALLYQRDDGNPFFAEELLGVLTANPQEQANLEMLGLNLPLSLKGTIMERVANLPEADQEALAYAATIGREFEFDLLANLTKLSERELLAILRRAINLQLIEEVNLHQPVRLNRGESELFRFRHALTREAIYGEMLNRERRMRHREVAELLASHPGHTDTKTRNHLIAEHYWLAGLPEQARPYALEEAKNARQLFAFREERHYLKIALSALAENDPERLPMLHRLGLLSLTLMDVPAALDWLNQAKNGYQQAGQPRRAAAVLVHLTFLFWFFDTRRFPGLVEELEAAAQATFQRHDPTQPAQDSEALSIYSQTAFSLAIADQHERAQSWLERGFQLAEQWPDPAQLQAFQLSLLARGVVRADGPYQEAQTGLGDMLQVIEFALGNSLPDLVLAGFGVLLPALVNLGLNRQAEAAIEELTDYETRTGSPRMSNLKGWYHFYSGDWDKAITELKEQLERPNSPTALALYRVVLAHFLVARNQLDEAGRQLEQAIPQLEPLEFVYFAPALWALAKLQTAQEQIGQAEESYQRLWQLWKATADRGTIVPILLDGIIFFAGQGNPRKSGQWLAELNNIFEMTGNPVAQTALYEAEAIQAEAEGSFAQAIIKLEQAASAWEELGRPLRQAQSSQRLARLLLSQPQIDRSARERAENLLNWSKEQYRLLQIPGGLNEIETLLQSTRLEAQAKRRATLAASRQPFQGLTRREVQVLIQICAGLTNKEIAVALSISEGTVELHVNHILTKLNVESRVQAAAYAIEQGWVKSSR